MGADFSSENLGTMGLDTATVETILKKEKYPIYCPSTTWYLGFDCLVRTKRENIQFQITKINAIFSEIVEVIVKGIDKNRLIALLP